MSSPDSTVLLPGKLTVQILDFRRQGDLLPMHVHDADTAHISIVARGTLRVRYTDKVSDHKCGAYIDFPAGQPHEFEALEDNTRLVSITKRPR